MIPAVTHLHRATTTVPLSQLVTSDSRFNCFLLLFICFVCSLSMAIDWLWGLCAALRGGRAVAADVRAEARHMQAAECAGCVWRMCDIGSTLVRHLVGEHGRVPAYAGLCYRCRVRVCLVLLFVGQLSEHSRQPSRVGTTARLMRVSPPPLQFSLQVGSWSIAETQPEWHLFQ